MSSRPALASALLLLAGLPLVLGGTCRTQVDREERLLYTDLPTPPPPVTPLPANFLQSAVYHDLLDADRVAEEGDQLLKGNQTDEALSRYSEAIGLYRMVEIHHPSGAKVARFKRQRLAQRIQRLMDERSLKAYHQLHGWDQ